MSQHIDFRDNLAQEDIDRWFGGELPPKFSGDDEYSKSLENLATLSSSFRSSRIKSKPFVLESLNVIFT